MWPYSFLIVRNRACKMRLCVLLLTTVFCLLLSLQAMGGELYYWKDKDGNVYMSDTPPETPASREGMKTIRSPREPAAASANPSASAQKDVVIYTKTTCPYCRDLKAYLDQKGVNYREIDVYANPEAAREIYERAGQEAVPITIIDGDLIVGFDPAEIEEKLK